MYVEYVTLIVEMTSLKKDQARSILTCAYLPNNQRDPI